MASRHTKNFASVRTLGLLTRLEVTHVNGLSIRIKRAFHKTWFSGDTGGERNFGRGRSRRGTDRRRRAARGSHGHRWGCGRISRRRRRSDVVTSHRSVRIGGLNRGCIWGAQINAVKILSLLLRDAIAGWDIKGTPASTSTSARGRRVGAVACGEAGNGRDQQECLQGSFHGVVVGERRNHAFTRMGIST